MTAFLPLLVALVASMSFAVIVSRAMGLSDPRTYGSGNPGATNVLRSGSKAAAILTLALDALKGYPPRPSPSPKCCLKFFCGFGVAEIAAMQGVSERTVQRQWEKARALLFRALDQQP